MPFYLGHPNNGNQTVSDALLTRNINLLRAKPSEISIIAYAEITQPAYNSYFANLPAFMEATSSNTIQVLTKEGFPISFPIDQCFPLAMANLIVDFPRPLAQDQTDVLAQIGYQQINVNNKTALVFRSPSLTDIRTIRSFKPNTLTRTTVDTVNMDCVGSIVLIHRIFSSFFSTHCYPAFSDDEQHIPYQEFEDVFEWSEQRKRKRDLVDEGNNPRIATSSDVIMSESITVPELPRPILERITLFRAKPSIFEGPKWGSSMQLPNASGILVPYVPHLAVFDPILVPDIIQRYFFKCLGSSFTMCRVNFTKLKSSWGNIHQTNLGNVLSHLACMIGIVAHCQARVFPIFDNGVYSGCVLSGSRFTLSTSDSVYRPMAFAQLQEEMISAKFHFAVLNSIAVLVGDGTDQIRNVKSMRELSNLLRTVEISEETKDAIRKEAVHLNFDNRYLSINSNTLVQAMDLLKDTSQPIANDYPMHPDQIFENDRVASVLSAFGYFAPTLLIPSCTSIKLVDGSEPPKTFACRTVTLSSAIADWKLVLRDKVIHNNPTNLSKSFKDRSFTGADKKRVWMSLLSLSNAQGVATTSNSGLPDASSSVDDAGWDVFEF
nr:MAG: hypothetical protein [Downy mildew lesion associated ambivirus 3]